MSKIHKPVDAIRHDNTTRATIPTTELAGSEASAVGAEERSSYDTFRHDFDRGRDPELFWLGKYGNDDEQTQRADLRVDIRSLYVHEQIQPEQLINNLYRIHEQKRVDEQVSLFDHEGFEATNVVEDELARVTEYYRHTDKWKNRLIQGDSLLVMNSLLGREGMAGKVQCIYMDPPYGIKYGSNWQMKLNSRDVKDNDQNVSGEPEMIKAFRDTWELGIHSYLSYLRDRLVPARELLSESGSVFVQISDENVHLVRNIMDEVFGSENFVSMIVYTKTSGFSADTIGNVADFVIWYAKKIDCIKIRKLFVEHSAEDDPYYNQIELSTGERMSVAQWEKKNKTKFNYNNPPKGAKIYMSASIVSSGNASQPQPFELNGKLFYPGKDSHWKANYPDGMNRLKELRRLFSATGEKLRYVRYIDDFPYMVISNIWTDTSIGGFSDKKVYVVQSGTKAVQRCILMTTDPGDLVLDPTCGSGTTAYVAEQWGRRWITIDTSRIALNIAKKRLTTAVYPYYELFDKSAMPDIRQGFVYKKVPHITLKSLANNEPAEEEVLYDQPIEDKKRLRVSGPFTVETLQNYVVTNPDDLGHTADEADEDLRFQQRIFDHLRSNGIRNGDRTQQATFTSVEATSNPYLNARGIYKDEDGRERLVYFHIGPKFGTVSRLAVNRAVQEFRETKLQEGASWLVLLGFSFEDTINDRDYNLGQFTVSKVRMHDDLMQDGLLKKDSKAGSFITIGEPDIALVKDAGDSCHVEIRGLDIYDPIRDDVKARSVEDIAYWELDSDYNGQMFVVRSMHFCGGDKKDFEAWRKGLSTAASALVKKKAERTLRMEMAEELWDTLYGFSSEPLPYEKGRKVAVRVVSQFGEESTKVITME